jgi:CubicO group peptidase (beta-lactamase class C family)
VGLRSSRQCQRQPPRWPAPDEPGIDQACTSATRGWVVPERAVNKVIDMKRESERQAALQNLVDRGQLAGAATLVWRHGEARTACAGWRDVNAKLPIEPNTIFRIASMSKPITSVAALMLVDDGRLALGDPIARYAPEFAHTRVLRSPDGPLDETDPVERPITFEDLLTHRAGLTYGTFIGARSPVHIARHLAAISTVTSRPTIGLPNSRSCH